MASPFSWPVLVPYALRAPAPVNLGVRPLMPAIRPWTSASEVLHYLAENWPFEPEWPDGTHEISVNASTADGDTPLHFACRWGDALAVSLLVHAGANVNQAGDMGVTPLGAAVASYHVEVAAFLLKHGASPQMVSEFGTTPLHDAMSASPELRALFSAHLEK